MRAILVDDEPLMLKSFMRYSAEVPEFQVIAQFESPEQALAFAGENLFELALLDIEMPKMNGIELAVKLRALYPELLISTPRGQMLNTALCDCDYYDWLNNNTDAGSRFEGEFLSEYSWGEYILADLLHMDRS